MEVTGPTKSAPFFDWILECKRLASKFGLQFGLRLVVLGRPKNAKSMKCFGGPGQIRTDDLFHAI
jgi:hypothetical protein